MRNSIMNNEGSIENQSPAEEGRTTSSTVEEDEAVGVGTNPNSPTPRSVDRDWTPRGLLTFYGQNSEAPNISQSRSPNGMAFVDLLEQLILVHDAPSSIIRTETYTDRASSSVSRIISANTDVPVESGRESPLGNFLPSGKTNRWIFLTNRERSFPFSPRLIDPFVLFSIVENIERAADIIHYNLATKLENDAEFMNRMLKKLMNEFNESLWNKNCNFNHRSHGSTLINIPLVTPRSARSTSISNDILFFDDQLQLINSAANRYIVGHGDDFDSSPDMVIKEETSDLVTLTQWNIDENMLVEGNNSNLHFGKKLLPDDINQLVDILKTSRGSPITQRNRTNCGNNEGNELTKTISRPIVPTLNLEGIR